MMKENKQLIEEVAGFYCVQKLGVLRRTEGVHFDYVPMDLLPQIDALDRVVHASGAISPGAVGEVARPWYMHTDQVDNLLVLYGKRTVDLYHADHGKHTFEITTDGILKDGKMLFDGPVMLTWQHRVFHRVQSDPVKGSASLNIAVRVDNFDLKTNFSIYDLDTETGDYKVIRPGHLDQPGGM